MISGKARDYLYYEEPGIVLLKGDCREILPLLGKFDLLLTDPPYGTEDLGGGYGRRQVHDPAGRNGRMIAGDKDLTVCGEAFALARNNIERGYLVTFCAPRRMPEMFPLIPFADYQGELVWDKGTPGLGYTVRYTHESALLFRVGLPDKPERALLSVVREQVNHVNTHLRHPHEKPVNFWQNVLNLPGKRVIDPFAGSCTSAIAAKNMGKEIVCIELEEPYLKIAVERLKQGVLL